MMRRGRSSAATSSSSVFAPVNFAAGVVAQERVHPVGLQVPDRHRKAVLLDVQRQVAPHRPEPDDAERAPLMPVSPARTTSARSNAEVARPHPQFFADERAPACRRRAGRSRVELSSPSTAASRQLCPSWISAVIDAGRAVEMHAPAERSADPALAAGWIVDRHRGRPAQAGAAASRQTGEPRARSPPRSTAPRKLRRALPHLRQIEEVRDRRAPARQARPAQIGERRALEQACRRCPAGIGSSASRTRRSARLGQIVERLDRSAAPPDHRGQARQPERRDRIVEEPRRQPRDRDRVLGDARDRRGVRPLRRSGSPARRPTRRAARAPRPRPTSRRACRRRRRRSR